MGKVLYLFTSNIKSLANWRAYWPPKNGKPTVLMVPVYRTPEPFYQSWRQGIESAGWNFTCLYRQWDVIQVSDQILVFMLLCLRVQAVHFVDLDLQTLFGAGNKIRTKASFLLLRFLVFWPKLLNRRVIYTFGNFVPHEFDTPDEQKRHKLICSLVEDITSAAPSMTGTLLKSGIPASRIWPVEHPDIAEYYRFPSDWPDLRQEYGIPQQAILLLRVGSIRPYKGLEIAVQALKRSKDPDLRLFIAGAPSAGYTRETVEGLAQGDTRIVLGPLRRLTDAEMGWMFAAGDYCILPYRDLGHSGMVCQSLGLGVPVIGSRAGCLPDYLGTGAGILFTPGDADELAKILDDLRSFDRERAREIGLEIMRPRTPQQIGRRLARLYKYRRGGPMPESNWLF